MTASESAARDVNGHGLSVICAGGVLEEIRSQAVEGLLRLRKGGLEVGGVLFGILEGNTLRVLASRPVPCEHLFGPSYTLSEKDEIQFRSALYECAVEPALKGLEPVGWYHSHTRSDIGLSEQDLAVHNRNFPRHWQVALVVKPQPFDPTRGRFFLREPSGEMGADPRGEFLIGEGPTASVLSLADESDALEMAEPPAPSPGPVRPVIPDTGPAEDAASMPRTPPPVRPVFRDIGPTEAPEPPPPRKRAGLKWATVIACVAVVAALALRLPWDRSARPSEPLGLRVVEVAGVLEIAWNPSARPVRDAGSAWLRIQDGAESANLPLDRNTLMLGKFSHVRHSESVEVRLRVVPRDGDPSEETVHVVGMPEKEQESPPVEQATLPPQTQQQPTQPRTDAPPPVQTAPPRVLLPTRPFNIAQLDRAAGVTQAQRTSIPQPPAIRTTTPVPASSPFIQPTPPAPRPPEPPAAKPVYSGPRTGRVIWTGQLPKGASLTIDGSIASTGFLNGRFPGVPIYAAVHPATLTQRGLSVYIYNPSTTRREPAGPANGWNETSYQWDPRRAATMRIVEAPSSANNWQKVLVRSESGTISVIVIDWRLR